MLKFYKILPQYACEIKGIVYEAYAILSLTIEEFRDHAHKLEEVPEHIAVALGLSHPKPPEPPPGVVTKEAVMAAGGVASSAAIIALMNRAPEAEEPPKEPAPEPAPAAPAAPEAPAAEEPPKEPTAAPAAPTPEPPA